MDKMNKKFKKSFVIRSINEPITSLNYFKVKLEKLNNLLIIGDEEGNINIFSLASYRLVINFKAHQNSVLSIQSFENEIFTTYGRGESLKIWKLIDESNYKCLLEIPIGCISFSNTSIVQVDRYQFLIVAPKDESFQVYYVTLNVDSLKGTVHQTKLYKTCNRGQLTTMSLIQVPSTPNYTKLFVGFEQGSVAVYSIQYDIFYSLSIAELCENKFHEEPVTRIAVLKDHQYGYSVSGGDKICRFNFDQEGKLVECNEYRVEVPGFNDVSYSSSPTLIITGGWDNSVKLFTKSLKYLTNIEFHKKSITSVLITGELTLSNQFNLSTGKVESKKISLIIAGSQDSSISIWEYVE